jgi:hypothetical protein
MKSSHRGALALLLMLVSASAAMAAEKSLEQTYGYSAGDFVSHADDRKRATETTSQPLQLPARPFFLVSEQNRIADSDYQDSQAIADRLSLAVGDTGEVKRGKDFVRALIDAGKLEKYPDIRSPVGIKRYAEDNSGGLFLVTWGTGLDKKGDWFDLHVRDVRSGKEVFVARNSVKPGTSFFRWNGISNNEECNPTFNSFIDWLRSQPRSAQ